MQAIVTIAEITSKTVQGGFRYWTQRCGDRRMPARTEFDPLIEIPKLCPYMMLKDVKRDPLDFRYRLVGTKLRPHMNQEWTGIWMSAIEFQRAGNPIWTIHQQVAESGEPLFFRPRYVGPHQDFLYIEAAILPLGENHQDADMLMIFLDFLTGKG